MAFASIRCWTSVICNLTVVCTVILRAKTLLFLHDNFQQTKPSYYLLLWQKKKAIMNNIDVAGGRQQVRDEVGSYCQKLFQNFLQEWVCI